MIQIRKQGDRAIIYDKGGDFVRHFYQEKNDIILNPFDKRTAHWDLWADCPEKQHYDMLSQAIIPHKATGGDPFWHNAARQLFVETAQQLMATQQATLSRLLGYLLEEDLAVLAEFLKDTAASGIISEKTEKTSLSVKAVLSTYIKSLSYLPTITKPFSIREWLQRDNGSWLFVSSRADSHDAIRPLISCWLDIAANALLSLPLPNIASPPRRTWIIIDELASLHQLPCLSPALAESRKFGGCIVIGTQSISQLTDIYGVAGAKTLVDQCNTQVYFRSPSHAMAAWVSQQLSEQEIEMVTETASYGQPTQRDGLNINRHTMTKPLVIPAEIIALENLQAYVKLCGHWPITQVTFPLPPTARQTVGVAPVNSTKTPVDNPQQTLENSPLTSQDASQPDSTTSSSTLSDSCTQPANSSVPSVDTENRAGTIPETIERERKPMLGFEPGE